MNSISYLDSVLSRSFAPSESNRPGPCSSSKRSKSHSSLPGSRRASSASSSNPSGSSALRRWSQDEDKEEQSSRSVSANKLRRTGSIPARVYSVQPRYTEVSDDDSTTQHRGERWSGFWGLTGWIDEAIHPPSRSRSSKNSSTEAPTLRTKRIPSLDDLLMGSTAPHRSLARRTASSGSGAYYRKQREADSSSETEQNDASKRTKRTPRRALAAASTQSSEVSAELLNRWNSTQQLPKQDDMDLMSEKEKEDIVEFVGGDFSQEEMDKPRERTISQNSADSSWEDGSSFSHHKPVDTSKQAEPTQCLESAGNAEDKSCHDRVGEEGEDVDEEMLLDAAKGDTSAMKALAQEDPASSVANPASSFSPAGEQDYDSMTASQSTLPGSRVTKEQKDSSLTLNDSDLQANAYYRAVAKDSEDEPISRSSSSMDSSDSEQTVESMVSLSKLGSEPNPTAASNATSETEKTGNPDWLPPLRSAKMSSPPSPVAPIRRRRFSATRVIRKALAALRDLILAVLLSPIQCFRYFKGHALRAEEAVDAILDRAQVPILEKGTTPTSLKHSRPGSLRFKSRADSKSTSEKSSSTKGRPRTPKPEYKAPAFDEPVTEDQAREKEDVWMPRESVPRPPSRLLPNPHPVDPMLTHDRKAAPIDVTMTEKEAMKEAERQSRIARGRAARRAAAVAKDSSPGIEEPNGAVPVMVFTRIPRGPPSSIIHHSPKILVLDLDETLIHSTSRSPTHYIGAGSGRTTSSGFLGLETVGAILGLRANENPRRIRPHMVEVVLDGRSVLYHVYKRPWVDHFLRKVASWYTVVIFTASVQEYADPVIDWLDKGRGLISARLFRESCSFSNGSYVKNLAVVDPDLAKVCLVDNSPASYSINRANGIPIEGWTHDPNDEALLDLLPILDSLRFAADVRHILGIRGFSSTT